MARPSRGFIPKCPLFKPTHEGPTREGQSECLAERDNMRFLVTRYKNGKLVAWRVPNKGHRGVSRYRYPISTPPTRSLNQLLDEAVRYIRRMDKPRA